MRLRASEWITVGYFAYLAGAAALVCWNGRRGQQRRVIGTAAAVVGTVVTIAWLGRPAVLLRDWIPLVYVLLGYWLPALFVTTTNPAFERTLLTLDHRWLGTRNVITGDRARRPVIELLELTYLFCYLMVPIGFASLYGAGLREETDRFWTAVLVAVLACYGVLPWLPTRPPRVIEGEPTRSSGLIRRLNLHVLRAASIQLNTFPSGHAAASVATALAVGVRLPSAGVMLGLLALGIAIGSVVGRYHYAADALAGAALGLVGFVISRFV